MGVLLESSMAAKPLEQFRRWFAEAEAADIRLLGVGEPAAELLQRVCGHARLEQDASSVGHRASLLTPSCVSVYLP